MNKLTKEEIEAKFQEMWKEEMDSWELGETVIDVTCTESEYTVRATKMYSSPYYPTLNWLKKLSDFFGTDNLEKEYSINYTGCETCDYGSEYGYVFAAKE